MKKIIVILLLAVMCISLVSCNNTASACNCSADTCPCLAANQTTEQTPTEQTPTEITGQIQVTSQEQLPKGYARYIYFEDISYTSSVWVRYSYQYVHYEFVTETILKIDNNGSTVYLPLNRIVRIENVTE